MKLKIVLLIIETLKFETMFIRHSWCRLWKSKVGATRIPYPEWTDDICFGRVLSTETIGYVQLC